MAEDPEIFKRCFRVGGQLYYGDCKAHRESEGTFVRHGFGRQVDLAVAPVGPRFSDAMAYETVVVGSYEGNWDEDVMSGQGTYKWSDGSSYEGNFAEGQLNGHGRFLWPDGSAYEGAWQAGAMTGQGRLDSRFDGKFHQGRFHRSSFQAPNGRWIDITQRAWQHEQKRTLEGDTAQIQVRRVAFGEYFADSPRQQAMDNQKQSLVKALEQIQGDGFVPFVVAEASLGGSALEVLGAAGCTDPAETCASVRLAVVAKRRLRDYHSYFYNAIQKSLRSGLMFTIAYEDDDEGLQLLHEGQGDWANRATPASVPTGTLEDDWQLGVFFDDSSFPSMLFQPSLFNGRLMGRMFLPEAEQLLKTSGLPSPADPGADAGQPATPLDADAEAKGAAGDKAGCRDLAQMAARGVTSGVVGQTRYFFEAAGAEPEGAGLPLAHCLRPAVCASGRVATGLADEDILAAMLERFGRHVPMHRTVILVLCDGDDMQETLS